MIVNMEESDETNLIGYYPNNPVFIECSYCGKMGHSTIKVYYTCGYWILMIFLFLIIIGIPCAICICMNERTRQVSHNCRNCKKLLGRSKPVKK